MYQALGLFRFIQFPLYGVAAAAYVVSALVSTNPWGLFDGFGMLRQIGLAVVLTGTLMTVVGQTPAFPWLCRRFLWRWMPDIDGEYKVQIESNWPLIKARFDGKRTTDDNSYVLAKCGRIIIKARLYTLSIIFEADDRYSRSETVAVSIVREGISSLVLNYIYKSAQRKPEETDSDQHFGAARIIIPLEKKIKCLEGVYWTDRNWHKALNTAGCIRLERL